MQQIIDLISKEFDYTLSTENGVTVIKVHNAKIDEKDVEDIQVKRLKEENHD